VRVHWLLALMVGVYLLQAGSERGWAGMGHMAVSLAIFLASVLFHEFGHCFMAVHEGGSAERITLWPLGGLSSLHYDFSPRRQILVAGIGPLSSLVLAAACFAVLLTTGIPWDRSLLSPFESWWPAGLSLPQTFLLHAARLNLLLGLFNLCVPAYPLDGGQILYGLLSLRWSRDRAAELTATIALPIGAALAVYGFARNQLLLGFIGVAVLFEAYQLRQLIRMGGLDAHPGYGGQDAGYEYFPEPERPRRKGWFARWLDRRAERRARLEERRELDLQRRVDEVLDKVSRQGIGSLSPDERRVLEEASRRARDRV
jgi:Zn-dependent protease